MASPTALLSRRDWHHGRPKGCSFLTTPPPKKRNSQILKVNLHLYDLHIQQKSWSVKLSPYSLLSSVYFIPICPFCSTNHEHDLPGVSLQFNYSTSFGLSLFLILTFKELLHLSTKTLVEFWLHTWRNRLAYCAR